MASHYKSNAAAYRRGFEDDMKRRMTAAASYLSSQVKADISQPGTLRYGGLRDKKGRFLKGTGRAVTVYNFTHSAPGNPPFKQKGTLRRSISYELLGLVARVGSQIKTPRYPLYLETGTRHMARRPYLTRGLVVYRPQLMAIITKQVKPGGLPPVVSNQFRSGVLGRGAAGYG